MGEKYPIRSKSRKKDFKDFIIAQTFRIVIYSANIFIFCYGNGFSSSNTFFGAVFAGYWKEMALFPGDRNTQILNLNIEDPDFFRMRISISNRIFLYICKKSSQ